MERISIFNYEAFYLDYLEGNLSEEDTQMLLQFLEEHPECRMEEDELVTLDDVAPMTFSGKNSLKQVDEAGPIGMDNVEHFMIADAEGLLDDIKQSELNAVVAENLELEATRNRYNAVYFTADESVVFGGKSGLKQRKTLVLWPYISGAVAAAAVVAIMLIPGWSSLDAGPLEFGEYDVEFAGTNGGGQKPEPVIDPVNKGGTNNSIVQFASAGTMDKQEPVRDIKKMNTKKLNGFGGRAIDLSLRPVSADIYKTDATANTDIEVFKTANPQGEDLAMENPIEPVTNFIAEKAKTEVDFKRRKADGKKKGGFFLKIGKFEFSKNKH
ncbi:MAG: hypothetical protein Crog4KO_29160 [Crocinitomicaceae bacterium]